MSEQYDLFNQAVDRLTKPQPDVRPKAASTLLDSIPNKDQRFFLRTYLRSNLEVDQEIARARCELHRIDYDAAYRAVRDGSIE